MTRPDQSRDGHCGRAGSIPAPGTYKRLSLKTASFCLYAKISKSNILELINLK